MRLGGINDGPHKRTFHFLWLLHVVSYFDTMALFSWPSWSSLVLERLLRTPLFFFLTSAHTGSMRSWTGIIFSKTLREESEDQKWLSFDGRCTFSLGWRHLSFPEPGALAGALRLSL
jgi:hypothetical protein